MIIHKQYPYGSAKIARAVKDGCGRGYVVGGGFKEDVDRKSIDLVFFHSASNQAHFIILNVGDLKPLFS